MLAADVVVYRWVGEGINICISTAETCLSYKSLAKCPEHVALHNKGITLQTTREIGTKLKPSQRVDDPVSVFSWFSPHCSCPDQHKGQTLCTHMLSTSHILLTWTPINTLHQILGKVL